jgi:hypothetical protein
MCHNSSRTPSLLPLAILMGNRKWFKRFACGLVSRRCSRKISKSSCRLEMQQAEFLESTLSSRSAIKFIDVKTAKSPISSALYALKDLSRIPSCNCLVQQKPFCFLTLEDASPTKRTRSQMLRMQVAFKLWLAKNSQR